MVNDWKIKFIFACISLAICILTINTTYAKYVSSNEGDASMAVARWRILVNDQDVHNTASISNVIQPVFTGTPHIASGVVAPTSEGYFDLVIDSTNTDLSFTYTIDVGTSAESSVRDFIAYGYSVNGGILRDIENGVISNNILLGLDLNVNVFRIYIRWDDSENRTMTNHEQTAASYDTTSSPMINVNLSFIQFNG
jgi:hypothetical protein